MSDRLSTAAKNYQNLDSTFKVSPFQPRGFGVQKKIEESDPVSKAQLWENYAQVKQLSRQQAKISAPTFPIQAQLTIGAPGDKYEREADTTASKVMQMPEPGLVNSNVTNSVQAQPIQRACTDCQEENKEESTQEGDGDQIQTKEEHGETPALTSIPRKVNSSEDPENGSNLENQLNGSKLDVNAHKLTHVTQIKEHVQRKSGEQDIQNEDKKRIKGLKANYDKAIKDENWSEVALLLNAFNDTDIKVMLGKLTSLQHIAMYYAAPEWLSRVKEPIAKLHPDLEKKTAITDAQMTELEKNVMGVTVALYANYDYGDATARQNNQAFLVESKRFAENEAAIGLSGDNITAGVPIPINEVSEVPIVLQRIHRGLVDKWQQTKTLKKDSSDAISTEPPAFTQIRNLALFAHGESYGIGMDKRNNFGLKLSNVKTFVSGLKNTVTKDIRVQVFSCNTALGQKESPEWFEPTQGGRKGDDSFASALAGALGEDASVYGHTAAGPTTEMTSARIFGKDAGGGKGGVHIFDLLYDEAFIQSELTRLFPSATNPADLHDPLRHEMWKHYQNQMLDFKKDVKTGQIQSSPKQYSRGQHTLGQEQFVNINSAMSNLRKHWVDVWSKDSAKISRVKPPGKPKSIKKS
jgi:hypothetical protein